MTARDIIIAPVITEKSMAGTACPAVRLRSATAATKTQIKPIDEIFKVDVVKINTVNVVGKSKNFARRGARDRQAVGTGRKPSSLSRPARRSNSAASTTSSNKDAS